jgi:hypothetical protein
MVMNQDGWPTQALFWLEWGSSQRNGLRCSSAFGCWGFSWLHANHPHHASVFVVNRPLLYDDGWNVRVWIEHLPIDRYIKLNQHGTPAQA